MQRLCFNSNLKVKLTRTSPRYFTHPASAFPFLPQHLTPSAPRSFSSCPASPRRAPRMWRRFSGSWTTTPVASLRRTSSSELETTVHKWQLFCCDLDQIGQRLFLLFWETQLAFGLQWCFLPFDNSLHGQSSLTTDENERCWKQVLWTHDAQCVIGAAAGDSTHFRCCFLNKNKNKTCYSWLDRPTKSHYNWGFF